MKTKKIIAIGWSVATIIGVWLFLFTGYKSVGYFLGFQLIKDFSTAGTVLGLYSKHPELIFLYMFLILVFLVLWIISLFKLKTTYFFEKLVIGDTVIALAHFLFFSVINNSGYVDWHALLERGLKTVLILAVCIYIKQRRNQKTGKTGEGSVS